DQRRDHVRLRRRRHQRPEQSDGDHEHDRGEQLQRRARMPHTRSTACCPARVNSPPGRTSSTRITAAKRNEGRYWLWFVGSAPPRKPDAKPIAKPPSVAEISRFMPQITTTARTRIVSSNAMSGGPSGL